MTACPQCQKAMTYDFLDGVMNRLESEMKGSSQITVSFLVKSECCHGQLKAINELNMYYIISEPPKEGETKVFIGAK